MALGGRGQGRRQQGRRQNQRTGRDRFDLHHRVDRHCVDRREPATAAKHGANLRTNRVGIVAKLPVWEEHQGPRVNRAKTGNLTELAT